MRLVYLALVASLWSVTAQAQAPTADDPFTWMHEIEGGRALDWARAENGKTLPRLQGDPRYPGLYAEAMKIATATDRLPSVAFTGPGMLRDFWQDSTHVRGLWRTVDLADYRGGSPKWRTLLDVDALAKAENANWVWSGAQCLEPDERLCLVRLSNGGKDASEYREFDAAKGAFVPGGFRLPEARSNVAWEDADTVLVGTKWSAQETTLSGYPFIIKRLKRGQPLTEAVEVFRGWRGDVSVGPVVLREPDGRVAVRAVYRATDFFNVEYHLLTDTGPRRVVMPTRAWVVGYVGGRLIVTLREDWAEHGLRSGDLIDFDLAQVMAEPARPKPHLILRPTDSQSIEQATVTRSRLVVAMLDNVLGKVLAFERKGADWISSTMDLPAGSTLAIASVSDHDDQVLVRTESFLEPQSQWLMDAASGRAERLRQAPSRFDASNLKVEQLWATSKDGARVPYFVVSAKDLKRDGSNPTLLYGYGGFQVSMTPTYSGTLGKLWLERGGVYVLANIRGGGEFGPRWHKAGLKLDRMRVYEDFFAVSEDLIARGITSSRRLGVMGASNGGLLTGVALTKRPELYNAVVIQVPLFDMIAYTGLSAGTSWIGEYGDPTKPAERAMLMSYSPYQNLTAGRPYPPPLIVTSTKDDRVHPAHARKAAARLGALGYDYFYYENIDGGHSAAANLNEAALRASLEYTYLTQRLMD
jgi:prolyl oligopeptidase